jgi:drug/metabolite transporter (DMT)-like permease
MTAPFPYAGEAAALLSSLLWACAFLGFARVGRAVPPGGVNLGKNAVAAACFAVLLAVWSGSAWPRGMAGDAVLVFVLSGVAGLTLCDSLLFRSMLEIGPQRVTVLMTAAVPLTALAAPLPPWNEPLPALGAWFGMALCLCGVGLAATERHPDPVAAARLRRGLVAGLVAAVLQAVGVMLARHALRLHSGHDPSLEDAGEGAAVRLYAGAAGLIVLALLTRRLHVWAKSWVQPGILRVLIPCAFFGTFLGIWANQVGLAWAEHAGVATTLNQLAPVWLIPLTTIFLGERHNRRSWTATLLAVAGVVLIGVS